MSEYLCIKDLLPLWSQVVLDAVDGSIQSDTTDEQDGQNHIGECGCEVHHLDTHTHPHTEIIREALVSMYEYACVCLCVYMSVCKANLSRGFNTPDETEKDDTPGHCQAAQDGETDLSKVPNIIRDVQNIVSRERERDRDTFIT